MNRKRWIGLIGILALSLLLFLMAEPPAFAHERRYVWTYEYATAVRGEREFEYYLTHEVPDTSHSDTNLWKHWFEFEYGITDRWDISFYQMFRQSNRKAEESEFIYEGYKIRTRYRFGEEGKYIVDPLLYFEWIGSGHNSFEDKLEFKLILGKQLDRWNISYNQILEHEFTGDGETEHEYAFGLGFDLTPRFTLGVESKGNFTEESYSIGPTIAISTRGNWWMSVGSQYGAKSGTKDLQVRGIMGIEF